MTPAAEQPRRHGLTGLQTLSIVAACAAFVLALMALMPDTEDEPAAGRGGRSTG